MGKPLPPSAKRLRIFGVFGMSTPYHDDQGGLLRAAEGGYLPLLALAVALVLAGLCAVCLGLSGRFLPHDERFLGMAAEQLCALHGCRIVHFMVHDRISFGGALVAV